MSKAQMLANAPLLYASVKQDLLRRIREETGWIPDEAYFNGTPMPPHLFKRDLWKNTIRPKYGPGPYVAIESNPRTIAEYLKLGICCLTVVDKQPDAS